MLYEPGERTTTVIEQAQILASFVSADNKVMLVLSEHDEIAGFIVGIGQPANRNKHVLYCVIGIQLSATGQGFGKNDVCAGGVGQGARLYPYGVERHVSQCPGWCAIPRLRIRGGRVKRNTMRVDGAYVDEYMMAKLIEEVA